MTVEDKLTKQERLRLECFNQAVASSFTINDGHRPRVDDLFEQAIKIENFIKAANPN